MIRVLTEAELRTLVGSGQTELEAIESVYPLISAGEASMPPIMRIDVPEHNGEIDIKSAYLPGYPGIAIKVSAGFFDNPAKGLPSLGGLMMVLDSETGRPLAALFDNGYLTDLRTGLAGAVAAKHLAPEDASLVAVIGAGVQARYQLEALAMVRPVAGAAVWARRPEQAAKYAQEMGERLSIPIEVADSVAVACAGAQVVVTTTPSTEPFLAAEHVEPGTHVTAVGSDAEHKGELDLSVLETAHLVVCDSIAQSRRLGELRRAQDLAPDKVVELGKVISGDHPGRTGREQITVCDLTGTGAQDTAIAGLAVTRAIEAGLGTAFET